jgi:type VI secretion system protein ImpF
LAWVGEAVARKSSERTILPSVLDRLIDKEPGNRAEPSNWRTQSLKEVKASVRRDLEWLLNARRNPVEAPASAKELRRSVYSYGLPDSTGIALRSQEERSRLARAVEAAISAFEPRLINVRVTVPPAAVGAKVVHFQIEAVLRTEPAPERVFFDSTLELISGTYEVEGEARAG